MSGTVHYSEPVRLASDYFTKWYFTKPYIASGPYSPMRTLYPSIVGRASIPIQCYNWRKIHV